MIPSPAIELDLYVLKLGIGTPITMTVINACLVCPIRWPTKFKTFFDNGVGHITIRLLVQYALDFMNKFCN